MAEEAVALRAEGVFWWYDGYRRPEDPVAGTVEVSELGVARLKLLGVLSNDTATAFFKPREPLPAEKWIAGALKDGGFILLGSLRRDGGGFSSTMEHEGYAASDCLVFSTAPDSLNAHTSCKVMRISLDGLEEWLSLEPIQVKPTKTGLILRGQAPEPQTYHLPGREVTVVHSFFPPPHSRFTRSIHLRHLTHLDIVAAEAQSLETLSEQFLALEDVFLLMTDADVGLPWPVLDFGSGKCVYYFKRRHTKKANLDWTNFWVPWKSLDLGAILLAWESQRPALGPGLYLYLGTRRATSHYLENRFTTYIWGLEALHRRAEDDSHRSTKLQAKISRILNSVEPRDRRWLEGRLRNAGEPSLEERLFSVFSELDLGFEPDTLRAFSKQCASLRNDISHFGGQRHGNYDEFVDRLWHATEVVRRFYHAILLRRLTVPAQRVQAYFHRSPQSKLLTQVFERVGLKVIRSAPKDLGTTGEGGQE